MRYGGYWRRAALLLVLLLVLGCTSCGLTAAVFPHEATAGRPDIFIQVTRIVETHFWDAGKLSPQALLKGAIGGIEPDLRRQGGNVSQQGAQLVVSLNGQTKTIDLSSITTTAELMTTFTDLHSWLLQQQRPDSKAVNWEYAAIEGVLKGLDANSEFMPPHAFREMLEETRGSYEGIGIRIDVEEGEVVVRELMEATPAARAGLKKGDHIVTIDGHSTKGLTLREAIRRMRGPVGSQVVLGILRPGAPAPEEIAVTRGKVKLKTVESRMLDGHVAYVKVTGFHDTTHQEAESALSRLIQRNKVDALILDLRNNPGGLLSESVEVCKLFVDEGRLVVYTEGRVRNQNARFMADGGGQYGQFPLIVLINSGSASGSEIVAGALQDYHKATIIGTKSYGKGSVQTIFPLQDGSGLRLTTARYFTPSGRDIDHVGIAPDIELENEGKEDRQLNMAHAIMKEALTVANRRKSPQGGGAAPIDSGVIIAVGRGMLATPSVLP